ncbi:MAG: hypothetical protein LBC75_04925 [Fibromonadaceae bacterium]|jgi:uncharacterized protein (TIGR02145 family)|nr:hypothetical protein [Fibromonadaceae bacterium]
MVLRFFMLAFLLSCSVVNEGEEYGEFISQTTEIKFLDSRDSTVYRAVEIELKKVGKLQQKEVYVWMRENLNFYAEGSKCYNDDTANCDKYGRLYDWETAMTVCPSGWHLLSVKDWDNIVSNIDIESGLLSGIIDEEYSNDGKVWRGLGGHGFSDGSFSDIGTSGYWWTSSENNVNAYFQHLYYLSGKTDRNSDDKNNLLSVRCVLNQLSE